MERKEDNTIYSAINGIVKVLKDSIQEQSDKPRKISITLDKLEIVMSDLKHPIKLSAKIDLDFSGNSKENKK
jgi:hypothetical protein